MRAVRLSLVVTAHRCKHLAAALASVARQTEPAYVLICCADSAGESRVLDTFERFRKTIKCAKVVIAEVAGGTAGVVRNFGFSLTDTEWVSYLDGDDLLVPQAIEAAYRAIDRDEADVLSSGLLRMDRGSWRPVHVSLHYRPPLWIYDTDPDTVGHATYFNQFQVVRRSHWLASPYDETTNGEDIDFMLHQLPRGRFRKIPLALYCYRDTVGSFSKRTFAGGDVCTRRYETGYYRKLFDREYVPDVRSNFAD